MFGQGLSSASVAKNKTTSKKKKNPPSISFKYNSLRATLSTDPALAGDCRHNKKFQEYVRKEGHPPESIVHFLNFEGVQ